MISIKIIGNLAIAVFFCYVFFLMFYVSKTKHSTKSLPSSTLTTEDTITPEIPLFDDIPALSQLNNHHVDECERIGGCKYRELATPFDLYQRTGENIFLLFAKRKIFKAK